MVPGGELIDVYDDDGRHRGILDRETAHSEGWWHAVFHLLIVANHADRAVAILQRRADHKLVFPGLLDLSATGHLEAGESPEDGVRELREELGVDLAPDALVKLGVRPIVDTTPEGLNRELCHVFLAVDDRPLTAYAPDPTEVAAVVALPLGAGRDLFAERIGRTAVEEVYAGAGSVHATTVTIESFVPEPSGGSDRSSPTSYWSLVFDRATRLLAGETQLSI